MTSAFTHPHQVGLTRVLIVLGLHHLQGQKDQINEVAFSHSGEYLFVPTGAGAVATYRLDLQGDTVSLKEFYRCEPHACVINCMGRSSISFLYSRSPSLVRPMLSLTHLTPPPHALSDTDPRGRYFPLFSKKMGMFIENVSLYQIHCSRGS